MEHDLTILIFMAIDANSKMAERLFRKAGLDFLVCEDIDGLVERISREAGALLLEAETLSPPVMEKLNRALERQPPWSEIPVILLTGKAGHFPDVTREKLAQSYTLVERPVHKASLISLVNMALKTRQRQYELQDLLEDLRQANISLEQRVARQTAELRQRAELAEQYSRELQRSNQDLEEFAYAISHDLQEPLRMVSSFLTLFARRYQKKIDSDADKYIYYAVDGADRMYTMIRSLLEYSRLGSNGENLETVNCEEVLAQTLSILSPVIEENRARITHDPLPLVRADRLQLGQVFQNLIGNGLKFRRKEPPNIHISAAAKGEEWEFSFRDNGIGIDPDQIDRIFNIFQRLHARDKYPGTGIGLAICKKIIRRHGGQIRVESEPGSGSTFYFTLPRPEHGGEPQE